MDDEKYIGFIKYEGELVEDGLMDARKQAQALIGLDEVLKYFIVRQVPELRGLDFEIPVRIKKGSWEALIPETVAGWVQAGLGVVATAYFAQAAQKMAEKDFEDFGFSDIFKKSFEAIKWFVKLGKHMGDLTIKSFSNTKFNDGNALVGISNSNGEYLYIPKYVLDLYVMCDPQVLEKIVEVVQEGRELKIGTIINGRVDEVSIGLRDKGIFCLNESDEDVLFPELIHGEHVVLEGEVTRENKTSNSMGFKYKQHILTAYPQSGSIIPYKPLLFLKCKLHGFVSRVDEKGELSARRPKLFFSHLEPIESSEEPRLI